MPDLYLPISYDELGRVLYFARCDSALVVRCMSASNQFNHVCAGVNLPGEHLMGLEPEGAVARIQRGYLSNICTQKAVRRTVSDLPLHSFSSSRPHCICWCSTILAACANHYLQSIQRPRQQRNVQSPIIACFGTGRCHEAHQSSN